MNLNCYTIFYLCINACIFSGSDLCTDHIEAYAEKQMNWAAMHVTVMWHAIAFNLPVTILRHGQDVTSVHYTTGPVPAWFKNWSPDKLFNSAHASSWDY